MLDYTIIRFVWWLIALALLVAFAVTEGHDLGVGTLLPFIARNDNERRALLDTIGPHREHHRAWLVCAGIALFAAWPRIGSVASSGLYPALLALLWSLFLRPLVGVYRNAPVQAHWRTILDWGVFAGSALPPLLFGITFGNLLSGVPFSFGAAHGFAWQGGAFALLHPFALLCGVLASAMLTMQGAAFLLLHTEGEIEARARRVTFWSCILVAVLFTLAGWWVMHLPGYRLADGAAPAAAIPSSSYSVLQIRGVWLDNYRLHPLTRMLPILALLALLQTLLAAYDGKRRMTFLMASTVQLGVIGTAGVSMYPFLLPSSSQPNASLTLWNAAAGQETLNLLFWGVLLFTPLAAAVAEWGYRRLRGAANDRERTLIP